MPQTMEVLHDSNLTRLSGIEYASQIDTLRKYSIDEIEKLCEKHNLPAELEYPQFCELMSNILGTETQNNETLRRLFMISRNKKGFLYLQEIYEILTLLAFGSEEKKLNTIFSICDLNGTGKVSREEFTKVIKAIWSNQKALGLLHFAQEEAQIFGAEVFAKRLFHEIDLDKDGFIDREQFLEVTRRYIRYGAPKIMETQTGGHVDAFKIVEPGKLMKKVGNSELHFYQNVLHTIPSLRQFCPSFFGIHFEKPSITYHHLHHHHHHSHRHDDDDDSEEIDEEDDLDTYIIMEDLCFGFDKPCILDLKMGTSSAGEDACGEKLADMRRKDLISTTHSLGMRLTGMRVWNGSTNTFDRYNKSWGRSVTDDAFEDSLALFFNNGAQIFPSLIARFLSKLQSLFEWMSSQQKLRFYSSSLLFIYDGSDISKDVRLKMIDFAHVFPIRDNGRDEGYVFGLTKLIDNLNSILQRNSPV